MIRKYHNHTLQTNTRHCEQEPQNTNSYKTSGRQLKQSNQLSLPLLDEDPSQNPHNQWGYMKQGIDNNRATALERTTV